jgi:hypothetical protein
MSRKYPGGVTTTLLSKMRPVAPGVWTLTQASMVNAAVSCSDAESAIWTELPGAIWKA